MKLSKISFYFAFLFLPIVSVSAQAPPDPGKPDYAAILRDKRINLVKADIFRELKSLSKKDQSYHYSKMAVRFWNTDEKQANEYFQKSVETGVDPATEYANAVEKLEHLVSLLGLIPTENSVLREKLIFEIGKFNVDDPKIEHSKGLNEIYIRAAKQMLNAGGKEKPAFDFAALSLKGENPAIKSYFSDFFLKLRSKNELLANLYFSKAIEAIKNNRGEGFENYFLTYMVKDSYYVKARTNEEFKFTDQQKKEFLEAVISNIQKDVEEIGQKKRSDCGNIYTGKYLSELVEKLLPEKSQIIEDAYAVCQNADIPAWRKPDFAKGARKTAQDCLDLAKEIGDRKIQANYLQSAAMLANGEKNYSLSLNILDGIEPEFRIYSWKYYKINGTEKLIEDLLKKNDFAAINQLLEKFPQEYRPALIVNVIYQNHLIRSDQKELFLSLINQARAGLNNADAALINLNDCRRIFEQLTKFYVELGLYEDALALNGELIDALNRTTAVQPAEAKEKIPNPNVSAYMTVSLGVTRQDLDFINKNFDQVYNNIGKIKDSQIRLPERYELLAKISQKNTINDLIPGIPNGINWRNK